MVVLKSIHDRSLAVLQSLPSILERRLELPHFRSVLSSGLRGDAIRLQSLGRPWARNGLLRLRADGAGYLSALLRTLFPVRNLPRDFYFGSKVNGRNTP